MNNLIYDNKSYVFVILRHISNKNDKELWIESYHSIRKFYKNLIIIIDDNSQIEAEHCHLDNVEVIKSEFPGAGEILPYYYFLKYKWADRMIFLHDSMFLKREFRPEELEYGTKFHWYFSISRDLYLDKIIELSSFISNSNSLINYINSDKWIGCFGAATIITVETINYLEKKYNLFTTLIHHIHNRREREYFERIIGIILCFEKIIDINKPSNCGCIHNVPECWDQKYKTIEDVIKLHNEHNYNSVIGKIWRGR